MEKIEKTKEKKNLFTKILKILETILMIIIFFISTVIVVQRLSNNEYGFLGFRIFRVETGSMIPKYNIADVILVQEKDIDKIKVGDDLVYNGKEGSTRGKTITHQVVRIGEDENGQKIFYTKGIANKKEDPAVYGTQIMGIVTRKLYSVTLIMNLLLNRYTLYFLIILPVTIYIFFMELYGREKKVRQEIRDRNKKAKQKDEKEKEKQKAKEDKIKQRRLGTRDIKRIGNKEVKKETTKSEKQNEEKKNASK